MGKIRKKNQIKTEISNLDHKSKNNTKWLQNQGHIISKASKNRAKKKNCINFPQDKEMDNMTIKSRSYVPRSAAELIKLAPIRENDKSNLSITKNRKLISFLKQPISPLSKCYLSIYLVLYPLQLYSSSTHLLSQFYINTEPAADCRI